VNPLVFDAHHDGPERVLPGDGQGQGQVADGGVDEGAHLISIGFYLRHGGPFIVGVVQIVPGHFVHPHRKHGLECWVDALIDNFSNDQFVDVEDTGVAQVKNWGLPKRFGSKIKGVIGCQGVVELFVEGEGLMEIIQNFLALCFRRACIQNGVRVFRKSVIFS
jgi:hypothetical protein